MHLPPDACMEEGIRWALAHLFGRERSQAIDWAVLTASELCVYLPDLQAWRYWGTLSTELIAMLRPAGIEVDVAYEALKLRRRTEKAARSQLQEQTPDPNQQQNVVKDGPVARRQYIENNRKRDDSLAKQVARRLALRTAPECIVSSVSQAHIQTLPQSM